MTTSSNAPTDDVRAEAIEAAAWAVAWLNELDGRAAAEDAVDAAVPLLLAPIRALHRSVPIPPGNGLQCAECRKPWPCCTTLTLDAIESDTTSEGDRS